MTGTAPTRTAHSLPDEVASLIERSFVAQVATLNRHGQPITWPMTPYLTDDRAAIEVSTGVTYPAKAERARRNPRVAALVGGGGEPLARITALATVRDCDLQANTDRFLRQATAKTGAAWEGQPRSIARAQAWHWVRVYVTLAPLAVEWWPDGVMVGEPRTWSPPANPHVPPSDRAPLGTSTGAWQRPAGPWQPRAAYAAEHLGPPTLTVVGASGFPRPLAATVTDVDGRGFGVRLPSGAAERVGPACLTFEQVHGDGVFLGQENVAFVGQLSPTDGRFDVDRLLPDFSLPSRGFAKYRSFLSARRRLNRRLLAECARRGQPVPQIHLP